MTVAQLGGMDAVLQKRFGQDEENERNEVASVETARSAADSSAPDRTAAGDERISLFWRVFGGTILSIVALITITLFNGVSSSIAELRGELNREREARAELVKKDEFNSRITSQYERMRSFDGFKGEIEALKERINGNAGALDGMKKDSAAILEGIKKEFATTTDTVKKDNAAIDVLKERVGALEGVKKDIAGIDLLKERISAATTDLKAIRDEVGKMQQEVERNKAGDNERKVSRDAQYKQVEEALKEMQKGLQACREKLARLEGAQPAGGTGAGKPPAQSSDDR
jgi:chromosome segregation ATPase